MPDCESIPLEKVVLSKEQGLPTLFKPVLQSRHGKNPSHPPAIHHPSEFNGAVGFPHKIAGGAGAVFAVSAGSGAGNVGPRVAWSAGGVGADAAGAVDLPGHRAEGSGA